MITHRVAPILCLLSAIFLCSLVRGQSPPKITIIRLKNVSPANVAALVEHVYKDTPGLTVEALPKMDCLAVRANAKVTKEVEDFVQELDKSAEPVRKPNGPTKLEGLRILKTGSPDPADIDRIVQLVRVIEGKPADYVFRCASAMCGTSGSFGNTARVMGRIAAFHNNSFAPGGFPGSGFRGGGFRPGGGGRGIPRGGQAEPRP